MRKIIPKHVEEKNRKKNQLTVGLVLIFLMLFSVIGYGFQFIGDSGTDSKAEASTINYNGFQFTQQNNFFILNLNEMNFIFGNDPRGTYNSIEMEKVLQDYSGKKIYIYSESIDAESEIRTNLIQIAELIETVNNIEAKTCEDNFIIIRESQATNIKQENNCIFIEGKNEDLSRLADSFLLKILGVNG
ncbi:hypothetical protein J4407_02900 [Candidatus Pacearchaeota archaeon]|nr:hypothetical protein [Candidatus Pacearchaeota archaeon]